jgi:hypothetical protein
MMQVLSSTLQNNGVCPVQLIRMAPAVSQPEVPTFALTEGLTLLRSQSRTTHTGVHQRRRTEVQLDLIVLADELTTPAQLHALLERKVRNQLSACDAFIQADAKVAGYTR